MRATHVLIRTEDGRILESRGPEAAERLFNAIADIVERDTFELRPVEQGR